MTDETPEKPKEDNPPKPADQAAKPAADAAAKPLDGASEAAKTAPAAAAAKAPAPAAPGPTGAKPAPAAAGPAGAKPAAPGGPAGAKPAAAPPPPPPQKPAVFGPFLADHGITTERLDDHAGGVECIVVTPEHIQKVLKLLRSSDETKLNLLLTITGVDSKETFDSVYHLWSYNNLNQLVIKVRVKKTEVEEGQLPMVPSLSRFWKAANWHERETYDLVGIRYLGHPYLRRILNTWDWDGHPLRRDYVQPIDALNDKAPGSFR
ncbi:MAG: NADH-quinone oxidoreductase subunit C [Candidatus Melainabacteria bacterium]|nr:NADH-quinone oxidoreductase subunit C [Candidatus Melainabacteria bacterium]